MAAAALIAGLTGCGAVYDFLGGDFAGPPEDIAAIMDGEAGDLVRAAFAFAGGEDAIAVDHHVHVVALGSGIEALCGPVPGERPRITGQRFTWLNPLRKVQTGVMMSASGIVDVGDADRQYAERLLSLVEHFQGPGVFRLLALDGRYAPGADTPDWERTDLYVPNDYVLALTDCLNRRLRGKGLEDRRFAAVGSVNPYRADWKRELHRLAARGVDTVKWLPNVMGIDPADPRIVPFYRTMAGLGLVLLSHTGIERALIAPSGQQRFGDPRRLRLALDNGVTVIMAHSARAGESRGEDGADVANFDLFLRMMEEPAYRGRLFGEISALALPGTIGHFRRLIETDGLRCRMVNGSDYPLPAARVLSPTAAMADAPFDYISAGERAALDRIYGYNPLLFDFVLKRTIRLKDGRRLPESMFLSLDAVRKKAARRCPAG